MNRKLAAVLVFIVAFCSSVPWISAQAAGKEAKSAENVTVSEEKTAGYAEKEEKKFQEIVTEEGREEDDGLVIVIDPGHCSLHPGARRTWSGVTYKEEIYNLKIALYLVAELCQYPELQVYITHDTLECPFPEDDAIWDNRCRARWAARKGADYYISLHQNANINTNIHGSYAYVMIPDYADSEINPYVPKGVNVSSRSRALGLSILRELSTLGIRSNGALGIKAKYMYYLDGSAADTYAVNRISKLNGVTSLILEHCFMSNRHDAQTYLASEEYLKAMAHADCTGILNYLDEYENKKISRDTEEREDPIGTYVIKRDAFVRSGVGRKNPVVWILPEGSVVPVYEKSINNWGRISGGAEEEWVYLGNAAEADVSKVTDSGTEKKSANADTAKYSTGTYRVEARKLNVRMGPGRSFKRIGTLSKDSVIDVLSVENGNWGKIRYEGEEGWTCLSYCCKN